MLVFLEPFFSSAEIAFRFLALNSVYSALLALVVMLAKLFFSKMPRMIEYGLWCLVLIRLVLPVDFSISYSIGYLGHFLFDTEIPTIISRTTWLTEFANQNIFVGDDLLFTWFKLLLVIWFVVSAIVAFRYFSLKIKLAKLLAVAHPVECFWIVKEINHWRREFNIRRQIIVIDSNDFLSPFTFGVSSPVVFIPTHLLQQKENKVIGPIIAHELAHIKRLDALWLVFQNLVQIVFCLNPVVWLAVRRLNSLREEMCDQKVLDTSQISNGDYGKSLLRVLRLNTQGIKFVRRSPELFATFFLSHKSVFKKRIAAIGCNNSLKPSNVFQYAVISVFALFFLPLSWQQTLQKKPLENLSPTLEEIDSPFPDDIRKNYQPPVVPKPQRKNNPIYWDL